LSLQQFGIVNAYGCIKGPAGAAWPYRLLGVVLSRLLETQQVSLETHTVAQSIGHHPTADYPYNVETSRGTISAKHVIHCTNGYAAHLLPYLQGKLWPLRGQMTVQSVPPAFPRLGASTSWSTRWAQGFDYITQSPAEDGSLYLGGGFLQGGLDKDEDLGSTDDSQLSAQCLDHLASVASKAFVHGSSVTIDKKWTGIMGFTGDDLPLVDRVPSFISGREAGDPAKGGEWIAAGYNGYGMVHAWLSGKAIAYLVCDREKDILDWFPQEDFGCHRARLEQMNPEMALKMFLGELGAGSASDAV
jgi:glycine/D-amino acid oxidase-like deaminating enzyme